MKISSEREAAVGERFDTLRFETTTQLLSVLIEINACTYAKQREKKKSLVEVDLGRARRVTTAV